MEDGIILLDKIVAETRLILSSLLQTADNPSDRNLTNIFKGQCGLAQCIGGYALQDLGLNVKPLATQSLGHLNWHGHAILTVRFDDDIYLIDPTFTQFCGSAIIDGALSPEMHLSQTQEGLFIIDQLLHHGHIRLTPERAHLYLAALCQGIEPFSDNNQAYAFFRDPPSHPYHYHHEPDNDLYSRQNLYKNGLLIKV